MQTFYITSVFIRKHAPHEARGGGGSEEGSGLKLGIPRLLIPKFEAYG